MPNGGWHVVETGLRTYGYEVDPRLKEIFTRYRRPLCGLDRLIADKRMVKSSLDALPSGAHVIRDWGELAGQIRALGELAEMAASTASTSPGRLAPRRRPCSGSTSATGRQCSGLVVRQSAASRRRSAMCSARTDDFRRRSPWRS